MRTEAINGIRIPLTVCVERRDWRIERFLARDDVSVLVDWQRAQVECVILTILLNRNTTLSKLNLSAPACARKAQNRFAQFFSDHVRRFAGHEGLARSRGLPAIRTDGSIA